MSNIIRYNHHNPNTKVAVQEHLKGKHREHCLCYQCSKFKPESRSENCPLANILYNICVFAEMVTPVWECAVFEEKEQKNDQA